MKLKLLIIGLVFSVLFGSSCNSNSKKKYEMLEELSWLIGNWSNKSDDGLLVENWKRANDSTYVGKSFYIRATDTLHNESIVLVQNEDNLFYIPTVKGQNNDESISFKLVEKDEKSFIFKNNSHDYPQIIEYKKVSASQLSAVVTGTQQGKTTSDTYVLNKK
ncbi:DUF6265 family protein [Flavobacterium sp.]